MALSRLAQQFADEIKLHDWSDAPFRADRAGHRRDRDSNAHNYPQLDAGQTETVKVNAMWVVAQVLSYNDPNFGIEEFAQACGFGERGIGGYRWGGTFEAGLRGLPGDRLEPGTPYS
jgi:hypothetical protein